MPKLTELPFGMNGKLYRSVMPFGDYDQEGTLLERYQQVRINTVVVLAEKPEMLAQTGRNLLELYHELGLDVMHLPIKDFGTPDPNELRSTIQAITVAAQAGKRVVIHCSAGKGRTGLFTACLAKTALKLNGQAAIDWTRQAIPGAIETSDQVEFIKSYTV